MFHEVGRGLRSLSRWRIGAVTAVATLAIGVGTATSMYAFLHAILDVAPQIDDFPAVGRIYASSHSLSTERSSLAMDDFQVIATGSVFESVGAYDSESMGLTVGGKTAIISVAQVSSGFFPVLRAHAAVGRLFSATDFRDSASVAVVSDHIWRSDFAGGKVGEAVLAIDGTVRTIVGVLPREFDFPSIGISADAWIPMPVGSALGQRRVSAIARLGSGRTWAVASAELAALARPQNANGVWTWSAIPLQTDMRKRIGGGLALMLGPAMVVLLIGCINVSCMLFARGIERDVELTIRSALGATRGRIMRQLLAESLLLAIIGGVFGSGLAVGMVRVIAAQVAQFQPALSGRIASDVTLLPIASLFSVAACALFGTLPAWRLSRRDLTASLKGGTNPACARFVGYGARDLVVFIELALAVVLIVVSAMWIEFFAQINNITPWFPASQIVVIDVSGRDARSIAERVESLAGVASVSFASGMPGGLRPSDAAQLSAADGRVGRAVVLTAGTAYFQTMGIPVLRGRTFDQTEATQHSGVVVLSESAAGMLWPGASAIGERLKITDRTGTFGATVIGVCRDGLHLGSRLTSGVALPDIYVPLGPGMPDNVLVLIRTEGDAHVLLKPIADAARLSRTALAPHVSVIADVAAATHPDSMFVVRLIGVFGLIALVLAASGIFGVISQSVAQRTPELGVRMALGASSGQVLRMVLMREAKLIVAAVIAGALCTVGVTKVMFSELVAIGATDVWVWIAVIGLCAALASIAVTLATSRIVQLDPWIILRRS